MATRTPVKPAGISVSPFFSPAIQTGQFLYVSGQAALDDQRNVVGTGDTAQQAEYVMQRIKTIVEAAGASLNDVVKTTTFLTAGADYAAYNSVRSRHFPQDPPASSTVIVAALLHPDLLLEIEAVAVIPG